VTKFGSFDSSTCKRVLDLLKPGDLTLGQVVIKRVAVVELGVNNGSGDGGGYYAIVQLVKVHCLLWKELTAKVGVVCFSCHTNSSAVVVFKRALKTEVA